MADNTKPDPTKTYDARFSSNLTAAQIASSTDKRDKLVIASDTEDVTIITKTQKRNIPFDAEANAVDSVNGEVGAVVLDTSHIDATTDRNYTTDAQQTLLGNTTGTNSGDQDISGIGTNASAITDIETKTDFITVTQDVDLDTIESDTATNNSKVTNATHTGDVTGNTSLTIADNVVTTAKISATGTPSATTFLRGDGSWSTADSGGSDATSMHGIPILDTMPAGALANLYFLIVMWYQNLLAYSQDISQWIQIRVATPTLSGTSTPDGVPYWNIISSVDLNNHRVSQSYTALSTETTAVIALKNGTTSGWAYLNKSGGGASVYINLATGVLGTDTSTGAEIESYGTGWLVYVPLDTAIGLGTFNVYPAESDGDFTFAGDGTSVDLELTRVQLIDGDIAHAKTLPYAPTTNVADAGTQKYTPTLITDLTGA